MGRVIPQTTPKPEESRIVERAGGFYWVSKDTGAEYGPFATAAEARADMTFDAESDEVDSDETLEEQEAEIGVSGWVDPDTGDLGESWTPRLEDH
jgi:hypothetical protein